MVALRKSCYYYICCDQYGIAILQDLLPCSLFEQFREKEDEYFWIQEILTELELIVDTTEQSIYRLDDDKKQKKYY